MAQFYEEGHRSFLSGSTLSQYARVKLSGSTANTIVVAGATDKDIGVVTRKVNTSGDPVDVFVVSAEGTTPMIASGAITVNAVVYGDASGKVTATGNGNPVGLALTSASADLDIIEVLRAPYILGGKLFTQVAASTAVTNTVTETLFDQSFTVPANLLAAGDRLRIRAAGIATATNSTDTLNAKLYIGGLAGLSIAATGALDVANSDLFKFDVDLVIRTAGAGGTVVAAGDTYIGTPGTANEKPVLLASSALDTTASKVIGVSATWSVANAGNSCRLDVLDIDLVKAA